MRSKGEFNLVVKNSIDHDLISKLGGSFTSVIVLQLQLISFPQYYDQNLQ